MTFAFNAFIYYTMTNFTVFGEVKLFSHMTNLFHRETSLYIIFNALLVIYKLSIFLLPARPFFEHIGSSAEIELKKNTDSL